MGVSAPHLHYHYSPRHALHMRPAVVARFVIAGLLALALLLLLDGDAAASEAIGAVAAASVTGFVFTQRRRR